MKYLSFRITEEQDAELSILLNIIRHKRGQMFVSRQDYMTEILGAALDQYADEIEEAKITDEDMRM